jgi:hypothetical protein
MINPIVTGILLSYMYITVSYTKDNLYLHVHLITECYRLYLNVCIRSLLQIKLNLHLETQSKILHTVHVSVPN